jgi:hypothetical protein
VLVAIREDLARLEAAAALGPPLDDAARLSCTRCLRRSGRDWRSEALEQRAG